jgi:Carbohydrate-binding module 48 (Isoamylase N-terminal domain)
MNTPSDPIIRRAADELRRLPTVDGAALRRVVEAAAAARLAPADEPASYVLPRVRSIRVWSAVGMTAAAAILGFVARGVWTSGPSSAPQATVAAAPAAPAALATPDSSLRLAASNASDVAALPQQFVLENSGAHRVSVVGDFNNWNPSAAPMTRSSGGSLWSAIVPILPGRHMYGFMVDDSIFVLDPRARTARDPDLGTEGSVRMVGRR